MSIANPSVSEKRFQEGKGQRYLTGDPTRIRCQAVSKTKLRQARLNSGDFDLSSDDVWPDAQCPKGAIEGTFLCKIHGGRSPQIEKKGLDIFMPLDLREKFQIFLDHPDLMNRNIEIATLQSRNASLMERLDDIEIGEEAYASLVDALSMIEHGAITDGLAMARGILRDTKEEGAIWKEIRDNDRMIDQLTKTQLGIEKDYAMMTSLDQVRSIVETLYLSVLRVINSHVHEESVRQLMVAEIASAIKARLNLKAPVMLDE